MTELFFLLLERSLQAGWVVLAILLLRLALQKAPRWITVLLWALVAIRLLVPVFPESPVGLIPELQVLPADAFYGGGVVGAAPAPGELPESHWRQLLPWIWLAGVAVMLGGMAFSWLRLRHKLREAVRLRDNIYQTDRIAGPFVFGLLRPRIYLPYHITGQDLPHILAHENAHIRRRDHWWKPIGYALLAVYWFHPLIWLAYILLCRDIELACDERVIRQLDSLGRADYSQALLRAGVSRRAVAVCPLAFGEAGVKERVKNVLHYKKPAFWILAVAVLLCAVAAVCLLTDRAAPEAEPSQPPETTEPTHTNRWLEDFTPGPDSGSIYPQALIDAVEAELNHYAQQGLPEHTTRVFSYAIYQVSNRAYAEAAPRAQICQVFLELMLKDYTLRDITPGGLGEGKEQVLPVVLTFGVEEGVYYKAGLEVLAGKEAVIELLGEDLANDLIYGREQKELEKRLEALQMKCREKLVASLLGEGESYADVSANASATAEYDLNGDGIKEQFYMGTRTDGEMTTVLVGITLGGTPAYQAVFSSAPADFSLEAGEQGVLLCSQTTDGSRAAYLITVEGDQLLLIPQ